MEPVADTHSHDSTWQGLLRWESKRKAALILLLSAGLALLLGLTLTRWLSPTLDISPWLYGSWSGLALLGSLGLWTWPTLRRYQRGLSTLLTVLAYLMVVGMAITNHFHPVLVGLLLVGQLLLALSFLHWVEYTLFVLVSLGVFWFCALSLPDLLLPPVPFMLLMTAATLGAGLFNWWRSGRLDPETPADELVGHLLDQDEDAVFLLDYDGERIIFRNYAAARFLTSFGLGGDLSGSDLLDHLGLASDYLTNRMGSSLPGQPEKHYLPLEDREGYGHRLEVRCSKLPLADTPYFRLKITNITERVQREHQVRRSLSINQTLLEAIPDVLITANRDDQIVGLRLPRHAAIPLRAEAYLQRPVQDLMEDFLDEHEQQAMRQLILAARRRGGLLSREFSVGYQGRVYHYELRVVRLAQADELLGMIRDITEAKRAEMALRRSEDSYRQIFNTGTEGILLLDLEQFHPVDVNREAVRLLGYSAAYLLTRAITDLMPASAFDTFTDYLAQAVVGRAQRFDLALLCADGQELPVEIDLNLSDIDGQSRLLMVFRDIGDKLARRRELEESELRYRTLVENMNEGLVLTDDEEVILFVNQRMQKILGMEEAEMVGKTTYELLDFGHNQHLIQEKNQLRRSGVADEYELHIQRRNGDQGWLLIAGSPYQDASGHVIGTIAIITDITDRKQAELKLQEKNNELDAFVYKASHDLRGPLTSIIGVANIARSETDDATALRYLELISKSTKRLDLILSELLDVTRISKAQVHPETLDLQPLVEEIFGSLHHLFPAEAVSLAPHIELPGPVTCDRRLLTSILQNLVVNAINYRREDIDDAYVRVSARQENDRFYLQVADNGIGIPARIQPKIFEMFYRGNNQSKGSGLGLYIVKSAVEKLGGRVDFTSTEGEGSTFTVMLPLVLADTPAAVASES